MPTSKEIKTSVKFETKFPFFSHFKEFFSGKKKLFDLFS